MEPEKQTQLKTEVLNRISAEQICPRSSWFFRSRECFLWSLWFLTVLLGALAVALTLTVFLIRRSSLYEMTHESWLEAVFVSVPFLWLVTFGILVLAAIYHVRHTNRGYRYPLWKVFGSSIVFSLAGGALLHMAGVGFVFDEQLGKKLDMYSSQAKFEQKLWQQPEQGRLLGRLELDVEVPGSTYYFQDVYGTSWLVDLSELHETDFVLLQTGEKVRLWGEKLPDLPPRFHVCGVFKWLFEQNLSVAEINRAHHLMRQKFYEQYTSRLRVSEEDVVKDSRCLEIIKLKPFRKS